MKPKSAARHLMKRFDNLFDVDCFKEMVRDGHINTKRHVEVFSQEFKRLVNERCAELKTDLAERCDHHEYRPETYTVQKRIFGYYRTDPCTRQENLVDYIYVYKKVCSKCGYTKEQLFDDKQEDRSATREDNNSL